MKPKDLKAVFSWDERQPVIKDGIFHVPNHYDLHHEFTFPSWHELFDNGNPIIIEFCSGNGHWVIEKAKEFPKKNWIAVEMQFERVRKIWSKRENEQLDNLFIVSGEAWTFAHHYLPEGSVEEVFINFPDPWPKLRHEKHRLIKHRLIVELSRVVKKGGVVHFTTDDRDYLDAALNLFMQASSFECCHELPYFVTESPNYGASYFETLWRSKGRQIHFTKFIKR